MNVLDYGWKRLFSGLLALALMIGMLPPVTVAAEETEATEVVEVLETEPAITEPSETEYVATEPVETTAPATVPTEVVTEPTEAAEATEETMAETTEATEETVAETTEATEPALPENVAAVQALIDALPTVDTVTAEDYDAVQDAYDAYDALAEEEKALIQGAEKFEALFNWFNAQVATLETVASGKCGDSLTWVLDGKGTLTISGTGAMYDYTRNGSLISENSPFVNLKIKKLVFEEGITRIGDCAFISCTGNWGTVKLPESLQAIGAEAFHRCTALTGTLEIPKNVREIGTGEFLNCAFGGNRLKSISVATGNPYFAVYKGILYTKDLTRLIACPGQKTGAVTFPANLKTIDSSAFHNCSGLTGGLTFPEGLQTIGLWAFVGCTGLSGKISLPSTLKTIELSAFGACSGLTGTLTLPHGVRVYRSAFWGCSGLTEVNIPGDVEFLGDYIFGEAFSIKTIYFDGTEDQWDNLTGWNLSVFGYIPGFNCYGKDFCWGMWEDNHNWACKDGTLSIDFVNGAEGAIPDYSTSNPAPWSSYQFQNLTFHGQVTGIGNYAFYGCNGLTRIELPETITYIGNGAFQNCQGLTFVELGAGVASIGDKAFADCSQLTDFRVYAGNQNFFSNYGSLYNTDMSTLVCVPGGISGTFIVPYGVTTIDKYAFSGCTGLTRVVIPVDVTSIGDSAFSGCTGLTTGYYTGSVEQWKAIKIGTSNAPLTSSLIYCHSQVPVTQGSCGENLYWRLGAGGTLSIEGWGSIPDYSPKNPAPWSSYQFSSLVIDGNVNRIGNYAFQNHSELVYVHFNGCVTSIGTNAFAGCTTLEEVEYYGFPEDQRRIAIAEGNEPLVNANWTCRFMPITGAQDLGKGLTSGQSTQLTIRIMPEGTVLTPNRWILPEEHRQYATLTSSGKITAKDVTEKVMITVWADVDGYGRGGRSFWILPKVASLTIDQGSALAVDMHESATLNLSVTAAPEGASDDVKWSTSDKKVATVNADGEVTLLKPGKVTITATATDGSKKSAKTTLTVYYADASGKLTAKADIPTIGLQPGQTGEITVQGAEVLDAALLNVVSSDSNVASVAKDESGNWIVTGGEKAGTATITATITGDPLKRKATCKVNVIVMQAEALELSAVAEEPAQMEENTVVLDAKHVSDGTYTFTVSAQALTYKNEWADSTNVTWASGNTSIATIKANKDGTATVTVKRGASGECAITATSKDLNKAAATLWLSVRDYAPRLGTTSPAMNLYQSSSVNVALLTSYENGVESVSLYEKEEISQHFTAAWEEDTLTLTALEGVKKGTYTQTLEATCVNGETYSYTLKIKVTETAPSVTVKQSGKYNLFYNDGTATLNVTVKGGDVEDVAVIDGDFNGTFENSTLTLTANSDAAPSKKVKLEIQVAGWEKKVEKTVTLATVTTAPKLKLSSASSIINTNYGSQSTTLQVLNGAEVLDLADVDINYICNFAECWVNGDAITLELNDTKGGTATLNIQKSNWTKPVKLTHKVTVQNTLPTLKMATSTLKLNKVFPELGAKTSVTLSQGNLKLYDVEITPKTAGAEDVLDVTFEDGQIIAEITEDSVKAGNYLYTCTGKVLDEETFEEISLKTVTLKITISATTPKVKLAATTFKLNRNLAGEEFISTKVTVPAGYTLVGFEGGEDNFTYEDGYLIASLTDEEDAGGNYTLRPILIPNGGSDPVTISGLKVKVIGYSAKVTATVTAKGKLDTMNPDSAITYTVKLKNCAGTISDDVSLSGQDGDLFSAEVRDGKVILTMKAGEECVTNKTYKVTLNMVVCGQDVSVNISFKVTQSALKVSAIPSSLTCYQAIGYSATTLKLVSPATAAFESVTLGSKTPAAFRNALGENGLNFNPETGRLTFRLTHPGLLAPGKSYTVYLDVTPKNAATNAKPTQVKLTVNVQK